MGCSSLKSLSDCTAFPVKYGDCKPRFMLFLWLKYSLWIYLKLESEFMKILLKHHESRILMYINSPSVLEFYSFHDFLSLLFFSFNSRKTLKYLRATFTSIFFKGILALFSFKDV